MRMPEGVRIEHPSSLGRGEHIRAAGALLVLLYHQVHRLLRDWQDADGIVGLRLTHHQFSLDSLRLFRGGNGSVLHVRICPEEGQQAPAGCPEQPGNRI